MTHFAKIKSTYTKYIDQLYAYALHLGFEEDMAMDAIHDVFYKLCINPHSLSEIKNLKFYLFRALRNRLIDINKVRREYAGLVEIGENITDNMPFHLQVTVEDELIEEEDKKLIREKVEQVLAQLTNREREVIYLRYIHEYDYSEVAEIMDISVVACRNLVSKSLSKLKELNPMALPVFIIISKLGYFQ